MNMCRVSSEGSHGITKLSLQTPWVYKGIKKEFFPLSWAVNLLTGAPQMDPARYSLPLHLPIREGLSSIKYSSKTGGENLLMEAGAGIIGIQ